jgi:hypothetical protein
MVISKVKRILVMDHCGLLMRLKVKRYRKMTRFQKVGEKVEK